MRYSMSKIVSKILKSFKSSKIPLVHLTSDNTPAYICLDPEELEGKHRKYMSACSVTVASKLKDLCIPNH